jgi:hypothetical protein
VPRLFLLAILIAADVAPQCGSTGSTTSSSDLNFVSITVNGGPTGDYLDGVFTSVTICVPGTSTCQTIDGILVDTGSSGLRVVSSVLKLNLPQQTSGGAPLVECAQFQDGFTWGPLRAADVKLASKQASNIPIQVIGESDFSSIPDGCSSTGTAENTVSDLSANGILGVGLYREDCGDACNRAGSNNPGFYYTCPSFGNCTVAQLDSSQQAQNPVWKFSTDNNGVVIQLPSVAPGGTTNVTGMMIFGIGTQSNNALGSAHVLTVNAQGNITTIFNGQSYTDTFIDSGSNGIFFLDAATTGMPTCSQSSDFYCPPTTKSFSATQRGSNAVTSSFTFSIANSDRVPNNFFASAEIGGPNAGTFDWGLPFFFGRSIFVAIDGQGAPGGNPPYWAY